MAKKEKTKYRQTKSNKDEKGKEMSTLDLIKFFFKRKNLSVNTKELMKDKLQKKH